MIPQEKNIMNVGKNHIWEHQDILLSWVSPFDSAFGQSTQTQGYLTITLTE